MLQCDHGETRLMTVRGVGGVREIFVMLSGLSPCHVNSAISRTRFAACDALDDADGDEDEACRPFARARGGVFRAAVPRGARRAAARLAHEVQSASGHVMQSIATTAASGTAQRNRMRAAGQDYGRQRWQ